MSCYILLYVLMNVLMDEVLADARGVRMIMYFDYEEVGSEFLSGVVGVMIMDVIKCIVVVLS